MAAHAKKSASGAKRWMNCPGSLQLSDKLADEGIRSQSSEFARLGTAAHGLGETCLRSGEDASAYLGGIVFLDEKEDAIVVKNIDVKHSGTWGRYPIDDNMVDAVQVYLDTVREDFALAGPHAILGIELKCDLSSLRPDMFGTNDASIYVPYDYIACYDYKHGQGVSVEVEDNEQELYYALGIAIHYKWAFEDIHLIIVQPRCPHADGPVRRWSTTKAYLREFQERLIAAADEADKPGAPRVAGSHCAFCVGIPFCDAIKDMAYSTALTDFDDASPDESPVALDVGPETSDDDLRMRLEVLPVLDAFIKGLEGEAMRRLKESPTGEGFGFKLVRKKSNRKLVEQAVMMSDPETGETIEVPTAMDALVKIGFPEDDLYEPRKAKGPAKIEKLRPAELMARLKDEKVKAPAKWIAEQVAQFTYKPEGGIAIAPASDPRPAVDPSVAALAEFDAVEGDSD